MGGAAQQGGDRIDDGLLTLLAENAATGRACALATVVRTESPTSAHPGDKAVITDDGELHGWIGGSCSDALVRREALVAMSDGLPRLVRIRPDVEALETRNGGELTVATTCPSGGTLDIFIDPHLPKPLLAVIGESPAARTLIELGRVVGFRTCGVHPGAQAADFPGADRVLDSLDLGALAQEKDCWVVVATMGHYDDDAVEAALTLASADVALVASVRRSRSRDGHAARAGRGRCAARTGPRSRRRAARRGAGGDRAPRARRGGGAASRAHDREPGRRARCADRVRGRPGVRHDRRHQRRRALGDARRTDVLLLLLAHAGSSSSPTRHGSSRATAG